MDVRSESGEFTNQEDVMVSDFKELRVYQTALSVAMEIQRLSADWPSEERYALTDQIRRSSRSVCANIAESWFKRRYPKHFVSKLSDACSEAAETIVWLDFARGFSILDDETTTTLETELRKVIGGLILMMQNPDPWCRIPDRVQEDPPGYFTP